MRVGGPGFERRLQKCRKTSELCYSQSFARRPQNFGEELLYVYGKKKLTLFSSSFLGVAGFSSSVNFVLCVLRVCFFFSKREVSFGEKNSNVYGVIMLFFSYYIVFLITLFFL
jgi:hypothetical protein